MRKLVPAIFAVIFSVTGDYSYCQVSNTNISNDKLYDGEPFLAVNPTNSNNLIIAWMGFSTKSLQVTIKTENSFDGGRTWANYNELSHISKTWHSADVSMTFRKDGAVFLSYIDYREAPDSGGDFVIESTNGGTSWLAPVQAWSISETPKLAIDRPWIMIDNSNTANAGTLYMTTKPAPWIPAPNRPYLKVSTDSNKTWSAYKFIDTTNYYVGNDIQAPMASVAVSANGALCLAYPSYVVSQSIYAQEFLAKSYNKGTSFSYTSIVSESQAVNDTNYKRAYRIVTNPKDSNQMAFGYMGITYGSPDIFVTATNDGGQTWSNSVRVNDDAEGVGIAHDMLWMNYDTSNNLLVSWRDRRNAYPDTGFYVANDFYCSVSSDNGKTFSANVRLSSMTAPFDSVLSRPGNDFMCSALVNDSICSAWGDTRTGVLNVFFAKASAQTGTGLPAVLVYTEKMPGIVISPNPSQNTIAAKFVMAEDDNAVISITDIRGKQVLTLPEKSYSSGDNQVDLNIQSLPPGEYFLTLKTDEGNQTVKFMKE